MIIGNKCTTCGLRLDERELETCAVCGQKVHETCADFVKTFECPTCGEDTWLRDHEF